ncbi:type IV secretory system conjugative DNA transfer family protein [Candidatus Gracilibacteria bacterium]|nr:type IV secretory system conjugative DNA transfer family protein [Candidatus Gracilibacteria bacterium]MCF7856091.1 type IV secretory system conjugative DNA transfer family protein [Candidatus Gracilibacteria bacterium]MCF7896510.1 type IV secretory system conjugative DNA transfer family protein [Candidatus Gracilibacteria bacterium]
MKVRELAGAFKQFNQPHLNGFKVAETGGQEILERFRNRELYQTFVLNTEELATVFHLPNIEVKTPNIFWVNSKKLEPPIDLPNPAKEPEITTLGRSNYRGVDKLFGVRQEDRRRHIYIIGKTGMGKSTLLENMVISDIREGKGVAVVDPHGDLADSILDNIPSNRTNDVIVFDPSDRDFPVAFNMLENIDPAMNSVVASGLVGIFKKLYAESWGPRLEHILRNTILSLLESPGMTMLGIPRMLVDADFRRKVVRQISDPIVKKFWKDEFDAMQERQRTEAISPIQNKVGQFLSSSIIRNIVGQPKSMVDLRFAMDKKKIFICNLSKGKIGEDNSSLLGSMIITKFQLDAMSRSNIPEKDRTDFYLYVDEFQNFATDSFATILSEARKYRLNLTMANQYIAQMPEEVSDAVFGNVGSLLAFQVGFDDAEYISNQFSEIALPNDLVQLPKYNLYSKLLIDGMPSQPFSAATLPPVESGFEEGRREKVIKFSRERYARPRAVVEEKIKRWSEEKEKKTLLGDEKKKLKR